ncbi:MAG TPA: BRCT domain-containing protein [Nitratidesulfovibrio sp.]|nr:BRCT domain-containing protein [Nitratidesulfovibrio sp.]
MSMVWDYEEDDHGQPSSPHINKMRVEDRTITELVGICKGMVAGGACTSSDIDFLKMWVMENAQFASMWPMSVLVSHLFGDERQDFPQHAKNTFGILFSIAGSDSLKHGVHSYSTKLPLNNPIPKVRVRHSCFCFTGKMYFGTRSECERATIDAGGSICDVRKYTNYLVVGNIGSRDWIHSTFGRKVECAIYWNANGANIAIINEQTWKEAIENSSSESEECIFDEDSHDIDYISVSTVVIERIAENNNISVEKFQIQNGIEIALAQHREIWIFKILDTGYISVNHNPEDIEAKNVLRHITEIEDALLFAAQLPF